MNPEPSQPFSSLLTSIAGSIPQLLFSMDKAQDKFLYLSAAYEKIWETTPPESFTISAWLKTIHPEDEQQVSDFFKKLSTQRAQLECRMIDADGKIKFILITAMQAGKPDIIEGTMEDVTSSQEYRSTIQRFTDRKNSLLQLLSHDLLGPLGNIQLSAKLLADGGSENPDTTAAMLRIISQNCTRSVNLIQNLVSDEFLTTSKSNLIKQRVELVGKLRLIVHEFADSPNVTSQQFRFICEAEKLYVNIDEAKFTQVIINLLSNALKFTPEKGIISLSVEEKDGFIHLAVIDNGVGIPADLQPFLFEKFTRARRPGLRGEPTIGLGLSLIKTVVEWHQGTVQLESTEGKGTSIFIRIPVSGQP